MTHEGAPSEFVIHDLAAVRAAVQGRATQRYIRFENYETAVVALAGTSGSF